LCTQLFAALGEDRAQRAPEAERTVADGQHRRPHATPLQIAQHLGPRLDGFPIAVADRDQLCVPIGPHADQHQAAQPLGLEADREVDTIGPQVHVVNRAQVPLLEGGPLRGDTLYLDSTLVRANAALTSTCSRMLASQLARARAEDHVAALWRDNPAEAVEPPPAPAQRDEPGGAARRARQQRVPVARAEPVDVVRALQHAAALTVGVDLLAGHRTGVRGW
jgi:hypothetical protein